MLFYISLLTLMKVYAIEAGAMVAVINRKLEPAVDRAGNLKHRSVPETALAITGVWW